MVLIRQLVIACLQLNILFTARHVPDRENVLAEKLSRFQIAAFRKLAPWAETQPYRIPMYLSPEILKLV